MVLPLSFVVVVVAAPSTLAPIRLLLSTSFPAYLALVMIANLVAILIVALAGFLECSAIEVLSPSVAPHESSLMLICFVRSRGFI